MPPPPPNYHSDPNGNASNTSSDNSNRLAEASLLVDWTFAQSSEKKLHVLWICMCCREIVRVADKINALEDPNKTCIA